MFNTFLQKVPAQIHQLLESMQGFAETGHLGIDSVAFKTRDELEELGIL